VADSFKCGDEPVTSGATELVNVETCVNLLHPN
jgi:hypothetical protein